MIKLMMNLALAAAFAVTLSNSSGIVKADALCNADGQGGCTDNGCSVTPGICGNISSEGACICFH